MHTLYNLPRIPKDQVESVEWKGDYVAYDQSLYSLGQFRYDEFIVSNPMLSPEILKNIKLGNDFTAKCIVWYYNDIWIAKLFTKGWQPRYGYLDKVAFTDRLDVVFISYGELNAEENWQRVQEKAPWAKRVDGVTGILEAHRAAAALATTDMFYVVDGDAYLVDDWNFDYLPGLFDRDCIFVWHSQNPVNDLEYGYGGVKLFPAHILNSATSWNTDLTTSIGNKLKVMPTVSNLTKFDTDEFNTWRSAFRECAKLASGSIVNGNHIETISRLQQWRTVATGAYSQYAIAGASAGYNYGIEHTLNIDQLKLINDHEWLKEQYNKWNTNT
jgi:hypothetical protein